ncbi:hypothetical protein [Dactylosporangium darangshiense]|uniref:DNA-binding protein n=1 Tax=Dactylosporangium darangshiense TaxID=579108 RepID=A0ABP8DMD8_9ACTN
MRARQFRLLIADGPVDTAADALFDRARDLCVEVMPSGLGCSGASRAGSGVVAWVAFDRVAPTLIDAVASGVRDLDAAGLGIAAAVADDSLVTAETIAERVDRPVPAVRSWGLPGVVRAHPRRPVYDWPEVLEWLSERVAVLDDPACQDATFEAVTLTLQVRALAPRLERLTPLRSLLM